MRLWNPANFRHANPLLLLSAWDWPRNRHGLFSGPLALGHGLGTETPGSVGPPFFEITLRQSFPGSSFKSCIWPGCAAVRPVQATAAAGACARQQFPRRNSQFARRVPHVLLLRQARQAAAAHEIASFGPLSRCAATATLGPVHIAGDGFVGNGDCTGLIGPREVLRRSLPQLRRRRFGQPGDLTWTLRE
jgi:hypothetical protein